MFVPRVSSKMGERAFSVVAPQLWNSILLRLKNLNLHSHFGKNWRLYISAKPFHPKSSVSRYAGSTNWNVKRTMIIEPDSDLQRLWARDTDDLGALEVFHSIFISHFKNVKDKMWHQPARFENSCPLFCQIWIIFTHFKWVKIQIE